MYHKNQPNVGKYTVPYMDLMGIQYESLAKPDWIPNMRVWKRYVGGSNTDLNLFGKAEHFNTDRCL